MTEKTHNSHSKYSRIPAIVGAIFLLIAGPIAAQTSSEQAPDISDEELQEFAAALESVQEIQQEMISDTSSSVEESSLDQQRFRELYQAEQSGSEPTDAASDEERAEFERVLEDIQEIQQASNEQMVAAVQDEGLDVQRFNQIAQAIQQNPELMQRLQSMTGDGSEGSGS